MTRLAKLLKWAKWQVLFLSIFRSGMESSAGRYSTEWKGEAWASYTDELCREEEIEKKE